MPQITLEYSPNITGVDIQAVLRDIHEALKEITDINTCKSRAHVLKYFLIGKGETQNAIIHLKVELLDLPNRTPELRKNIGEKLLRILEKHFAPRITALKLNCKPTVHVAKLKVYAISSDLFKTDGNAITTKPGNFPNAKL